MSTNDKLQVLRTMASKPVEETFQGILRVSNYKELQDNTPDEYLNKKYYGIDNTATWKDSIQDTIFAYYGNVNRFIKNAENDKDYRNLKLPVTDSRGYFLNLFLGEADSTIGIKQEIGEIDKTAAKKYFPIIKTNILKIGTTAFNIADIISSDDVTLNIVKDDYNPKFIIYSSHYHNDNKLAAKNTSDTYLTIFTDDESSAPRKNDAFIYRQEYIDKNTSIPASEKHAYVYIQNIEEYIEKRLDSFFEMNTKSLPTGMIIYHYSTLKNWYCPKDGYTDSNDYIDTYAGYRPALYEKNISQPKDNQFSTYNTVQGVSTGEPHLSWETNKLEEIVPEYKRDYALCDGRSYNFIIAPGASNKEKYNTAFKRFYNLFHCLGYYYTYDDAICVKGHYKNKKNSNGKYSLSEELLDTQRVDKHLLYEITMAAANVFKALNYAINNKGIFDEHIKGSDGYYNRSKAETWLQNCNFASIPGCIYFESYNGTLQDYTPANDIASIKVGSLIKSFRDKISYYYYDSNTFYKVAGGVEIWKTAEAQKMLDLFNAREVLEHSFSNIFSYHFNIPKLYTNSDPEINQAGLNDKNYGLFIGSSGLLGANSINDIKTGVTYTPINIPFIQNHTCTFNPGHYPHAHGTTASTRTFSTYENVFANFKADTFNTANSVEYIAADYACNSYHNIVKGYQTVENGSERSHNYFINQVDGATEAKIYGEQMNGIPSKDFTYEDCNWYGRTNTVTNITSITGSLDSNKSTWTKEYIFRPENIRMLPLIKL